MEIIKENIKTADFIKKISVNKTLNKTVKIPDLMPDFQTAPRFRAYVCLSSADVSDGSLLYKGEVRLFFAVSPTSEYIRTVIPLEDSLPLSPEETEDCEYKPENADITGGSVSFTPEGDLSCSLNIILGFIALKSSALDVITDIEGGSAQKEKSYFTQNTIGGFSREPFKIKNEFNLIDVIETDEIDEIDSIYEIAVTLKNIVIKTTDEDITAEGNALINITYSPKSKNNSVNFKKKVPFSKVFPLKNGSNVKFCNMSLSVTDDTISAKPDENGKNLVIDYEIEITASWFLICEEKIPYISEVHEVNKKIDKQYTNLSCLSLLCRNGSEFVVSEPLILDEADPPLLQIYRISCTAVTDSVTPSRDKITIEGFLTADILYAAKDDNNPLYNTSAVFPYKRSIELPGVSPNSNLCLYTLTTVKYADSKISDETNITVDAKISLTAYAFKINSLPLITDLSISNLTEEELSALPSMVLCVVKPGDSLLKIAKKYNSTVADIAEINKLETTAKPPSGSKLLIVKKVS